MTDHDGAPPLEEDPVAKMLGLLPPVPLLPDALAAAHANARLWRGELAARLQFRGWRVTAWDLDRWENRACALLLPPALVEHIAEELGVSPEQLTHTKED